MPKVMRKMIQIDEDRCDGCGLCMPSCPEQALQLVDTPAGKKARLVGEIFCDGLGACVGACPTGAMTVQEMEAEPYDDSATVQRIREVAPEMLQAHMDHMREHGMVDNSRESNTVQLHHGGGCPGSRMIAWKEEASSGEEPEDIPSELTQWPVQLHLVSPSAPYFRDADLVIAADCVPFAYPNFHRDFLKGKAVAVGCPKLDDIQAYISKIRDIARQSRPRSIQVAFMEVPCCFGLVQAVKMAVNQAELDIPVEPVRISVRGEKEVLSETRRQAG
ncbi:MAG TPA: 4Fe-4S dicluster domain-containing protein [Thermoanaerobaculia bacterium]|nr:4Fe-4S dicluster domain-containing protein [Thermoanaerobaculia bacterium]HUM30031.1 4Fe-4S dicluster domain-containing protein [Thermoanaerobaculia bacterium]HXK68280.1 4Fe-4S dicluster domain-containing protein [Thermoanaerobaculia bacterium]